MDTDESTNGFPYKQLCISTSEIQHFMKLSMSAGKPQSDP